MGIVGRVRVEPGRNGETVGCLGFVTGGGDVVARSVEVVACADLPGRVVRCTAVGAVVVIGCAVLVVGAEVPHAKAAAFEEVRSILADVEKVGEELKKDDF